MVGKSVEFSPSCFSPRSIMPDTQKNLVKAICVQIIKPLHIDSFFPSYNGSRDIH